MTVEQLLASLDSEDFSDRETAIIKSTVYGINDISLVVLDIVRNSLDAAADLISVKITEDDNAVSVSVTDNGRGIPSEALSRVTDIGYTTRKERRFGLGIPLIAAMAEQTGGCFRITSSTGDNSGTVITAEFHKKSPLCPPIGNLAATVVAVISGLNGARLIFSHILPSGNEVSIDTDNIIDALHISPQASLSLRIAGEYLAEQYKTK